MNKSAIVLVALTLALTGVVSRAMAGPYYVSGNVGYTMAVDSDAKVKVFNSDYATLAEFDPDTYAGLVNADFKYELSYEDGYMLDVALGNAFAENLRAELEVAYRSNDLEDISGFNPNSGLPTTRKADGEMTSWSLMANFYFDFENKTAFKPFLGAGVGYANVDLDSDDVERDNSDLGQEFVGSFGGDDDVLAYQLMVGCGYQVSKNLIVDLQYRYYATEDLEFSKRYPNDFIPNEYYDNDYEIDYATHNIMLGMRYNF